LKEEHGCRKSAIWLLGDSNPKNWQDKLKYPFDPRHPAIHSIWTPVADRIQDRVYRKLKARVDFQRIYIRNAIADPSVKPHSSKKDWEKEVNSKIPKLWKLLDEYRPKILFSFGSFSFEFARRTLKYKDIKPYNYWSTERLGGGFRKSISSFDLKQINLIPLLHVSIARRYYIKSHKNFCGNEVPVHQDANYFNWTGERLADLLVRHRDTIEIWV
jgi:hypothetical protein